MLQPGGELAALVARHARENDGEARSALLSWLEQCLKEGKDRDIARALQQAPSQAAYRALRDLLCCAVDHAGKETDRRAVTARMFAFPVILVVAAKGRAKVPGSVPEISAIQALLERHGALGATRNFGLGNALSTFEALESLPPSTIYGWHADWAAGGGQREFTPSPVAVTSVREQVHLRFLVGAAITPGDAPSFLETAANIGTWGMAFARALGRQLGQPGLDLLTVPRPPLSLIKAAHAGKAAQLELAFNLFASNTLRDFRSKIGDPTVIISAHRLRAGGAEIRVSMSSALDEALLEGFRWPLHPIDDLGRILNVIDELLLDCRVTDVRTVESVMPEYVGSGMLFLREGLVPRPAPAR